MAQPNLIRVGLEGDLQELSMFGRVLTERWIDGLTRRDRAADTTLREDIIGRKKAFLLSYALSDQEVVDRMDELFETGGKIILEITHLASVKTYTTLISPFEKTRVLAVYGGIWGDVAVEFEQV
jgi:hypothetical protein